MPQPAEQQIKNQEPEPTLRYNASPQVFAASDDKYTQIYHNNQGNRYQAPISVPVPLSVPVPVPVPTIPRYLQYKNIAQNEERQANDNRIQQEPEYNDEPGKAHSFGNGYSFEFSG